MVRHVEGAADGRPSGRFLPGIAAIVPALMFIVVGRRLSAQVAVVAPEIPRRELSLVFVSHRRGALQVHSTANSLFFTMSGLDFAGEFPR
jgi:hypothetical protein